MINASEIVDYIDTALCLSKRYYAVTVCNTMRNSSVRLILALMFLQSDQILQYSVFRYIDTIRSRDCFCNNLQHYVFP